MTLIAFRRCIEIIQFVKGGNSGEFAINGDEIGIVDVFENLRQNIVEIYVESFSISRGSIHWSELTISIDIHRERDLKGDENLLSEREREKMFLFLKNIALHGCEISLFF